MVEKNIIIDGLNIHLYQSDGFDFRRSVVFLHGWGSQSSHLKSLFSGCKNFVALDLPGFGKSERPKSTWSIGDYANFFEKLLLKLKIENPVLVGHSFGGSIILKYCSTHSDVKKIILIGSAGIRNDSKKLFIYKIGAKIFNIFFSLPIVKLLKDKIRKNFYVSIGSEDYLNAGEMRDIFQKVIKEDLREDMRNIVVPAALIWGENDKETPIMDGIEMNKLLLNSQLFKIPNAGHYVFLDNKNEFNKIFFEQVS